MGVDRQSLIDQALLATVVTAFLIREGGQLVMEVGEWDQAVQHQSSLYILKQGKDGSVLLALLPQTVQS